MALHAAEVYSARGLETMAHLRERQGRNDDAESYYLKEQERHNDAGALISFYHRHDGETPGTPYAEKLKRATAKVFPQGLKRVSLKDFQGAPRQGVLIDGENEKVRQAGLKRGDIIVALDGERTDTMEQYMAVRNFDRWPEMKFIYFREGTYRELAYALEGRMFNVSFVSYRP